MPRWRINREGREIGFLEAPDWVLDAGITQLPGFEGNDTGVGIIVELRGRPVAAVVYPWSNEAIEIGHPSRLTWIEDERAFPADQAIAGFDATIDLFGPEPPGGGYAQIYWRIRSQQREFESRPREPWELTLEVHDESSLDASLRWRSWDLPGFAEGYFRGLFRSRAGDAQGGGEFSGRFEFDGRGPGQGYLRGLFFGQGAENQREFYVDLDFESRFVRGRYASFRLRGRYPSADDEHAVFSIPWLFQKLFANIQAEERGVPFTLWIGRVSYDSAASDLYSDAAVRRTLAASLLENAPLSARDILSVTRWLRFQVGREDVAAGSAWREALQQPSLGFRVKTLERPDCEFVFDSSVPAEKVLDLLTSLAQAVHRRGGRLCFGQDFEE